MSQSPNLNIQEESDLKKITDLVRRNYILFAAFLLCALGIAFLVNHIATPLYQVSSSLLIKEDASPAGPQVVNDYLNSRLVITDRNFQNELWVLKSSPVLEQTISNLGLQVSYYRKDGLRYPEAYKDVPFRILLLKNHVQPVGVRFYLTYQGNIFHLRSESKRISLYNFATNEFTEDKQRWTFQRNGRFGELIETPDLAFIIELDTLNHSTSKPATWYGFEFTDLPTLKERLQKRFEFNVVEKNSTVVEIVLKSETTRKGTDIVNELMKVYSEQNLNRKNHTAGVTIDYIEKQLDEISDSLSLTEDNLQNFRSSNQLLNVEGQATGLSAQYMSLQNQLAELVTRKKYYDYVDNYLATNDNFSNMVVPASLGIQDPLLTTLMTELIASQAELSNLIQSNQERNPLVQKLGIEIENKKKTITENISAVTKTTDISIDEMTRRISRIEGEISRLPATQRRLGNIERKYKLNDAIYNYLLEKRAEAKITQASNQPDNIIIDSAKMESLKPVYPDKTKNYLIAFLFGLLLPFGVIITRKTLSNKIASHEDIERITSVPVVGKILHNRNRTNNIMYDFKTSGISESFRVLRTNLDFYIRNGDKKVIMVTSCLEGEGKSFIALNLAMGYAQLDRRTILVNFDLRVPSAYFENQKNSYPGLSAYLINNASVEEIIVKSPHDKLDYIPAGAAPPNPVELLALEKTGNLINHLKYNYDIIIIDTTPLAQVTDAYLLLGYSDIKLIVARYNFTNKKVLSLMMKDLKQKEIANVFVVMNDNRVNRDQYGYGYGYDKR